jgi:hypothetical protein
LSIVGISQGPIDWRTGERKLEVMPNKYK